MAQLKPPLTYSEQIERLKKAHNLTIDNDAEAFRILEKVGYYRLSAYGIGLTQDGDKEKYRDGISLEHIYKLYKFDSAFRNALFHVIEQLEIQLRAQISNYLALEYGAESYARSELFTDKTRKDGQSVHEIVMKSFKQECSRQKNVPFVKHHMEKYEGHFPVWVALELFTFGNLSSLYSIMVPRDRKEIAKLYDTEPNYLGSWILALVEIRNICAHSGRLYNMPLKQSPHLYSEYKIYRTGAVNKVFPVLITISRMLFKDDRWLDFAKHVDRLISQYCDVVNLSFIGFPEEWKDVLLSKTCQPPICPV